MRFRELTSRIVLERLFREVPSDASILDVGCLNFTQYHTSRRLNLAGHRHAGVDYAAPSSPIPPGFTFKSADLNNVPLPFEDDSFDLVVASHIMEHLADPVGFFGECARVCKPGGLVYFEAPSERSLLLPGMPFDHQKFLSTSFFDDPTHAFRPWSPQAFYRLARYFQCDPLETGYYTSLKVRLLFPLLMAYALMMRDSRRLQSWTWRAVGWASYLVVRKPSRIRGKPAFNYYIPELS